MLACAVPALVQEPLEPGYVVGRLVDELTLTFAAA